MSIRQITKAEARVEFSRRLGSQLHIVSPLRRDQVNPKIGWVTNLRFPLQKLRGWLLLHEGRHTNDYAGGRPYYVGDITRVTSYVTEARNNLDLTTTIRRRRVNEIRTTDTLAATIYGTSWTTATLYRPYSRRVKDMTYSYETGSTAGLTYNIRELDAFLLGLTEHANRSTEIDAQPLLDWLVEMDTPFRYYLDRAGWIPANYKEFEKEATRRSVEHTRLVDAVNAVQEETEERWR